MKVKTIIGPVWEPRYFRFSNCVEFVLIKLVLSDSKNFTIMIFAVQLS